jgi:hypothetical protein
LLAEQRRVIRDVVNGGGVVGTGVGLCLIHAMTSSNCFDESQRALHPGL